MWLFTLDGLLSIVKHRDYDDRFLVRSRTPVVLERRFLEDADYRHRVVVPWERLMCELMSEMNSLFRLGYTDFKGACGRRGDPDYLEALGRVWEVMRDYQDRREAA